MARNKLSGSRRKQPWSTWSNQLLQLSRMKWWPKTLVRLSCLRMSKGYNTRTILKTLLVKREMKTKRILMRWYKSSEANQNQTSTKSSKNSFQSSTSLVEQEGKKISWKLSWKKWLPKSTPSRTLAQLRVRCNSIQCHLKRCSTASPSSLLHSVITILVIKACIPPSTRWLRSADHIQITGSSSYQEWGSNRWFLSSLVVHRCLVIPDKCHLQWTCACHHTLTQCNTIKISEFRPRCTTRWISFLISSTQVINTVKTTIKITARTIKDEICEMSEQWILTLLDISFYKSIYSILTTLFY